MNTASTFEKERIKIVKLNLEKVNQMRNFDQSSYQEKATKQSSINTNNQGFINPRTLHNEPTLSVFASKNQSFKDPGVKISERARSQLRCQRTITNKLSSKVKMNSGIKQDSEDNANAWLL